MPGDIILGRHYIIFIAALVSAFLVVPLLASFSSALFTPFAMVAQRRPETTQQVVKPGCCLVVQSTLDFDLQAAAITHGTVHVQGSRYSSPEHEIHIMIISIKQIVHLHHNIDSALISQLAFRAVDREASFDMPRAKA